MTIPPLSPEEADRFASMFTPSWMQALDGQPVAEEDGIGSEGSFRSQESGVRRIETATATPLKPMPVVAVGQASADTAVEDTAAKDSAAKDTAASTTAQEAREAEHAGAPSAEGSVTEDASIALAGLGIRSARSTLSMALGISLAVASAVAAATVFLTNAS